MSGPGFEADNAAKRETLELAERMAAANLKPLHITEEVEVVSSPSVGIINPTLSQQIIELLKQSAVADDGGLSVRHIKGIIDAEGVGSACSAIEGLGIRKRIFEGLTSEQEGKLRTLLNISDQSPEIFPRRDAVRKKDSVTAAKCTQSEVINGLVFELKTIIGLITTAKKVTDMDKRIIKVIIADLLKFKLMPDNINEINRYIDEINTVAREAAIKAAIKAAAKGGGRRARSTKRTKRTKGKSRGRAGKATRVRRNNNNNNNKTKRNKGKKRRTKRA